MLNPVGHRIPRPRQRWSVLTGRQRPEQRNQEAEMSLPVIVMKYTLYRLGCRGYCFSGYSGDGSSQTESKDVPVLIYSDSLAFSTFSEIWRYWVSFNNLQLAHPLVAALG